MFSEVSMIVSPEAVEMLKLEACIPFAGGDVEAFKVEFKLELPVHGFEEQGAAEQVSRDADRGAAGARRADEHVESK